MADVVEIIIPRPTIQEGSAFTATANCRTRSDGSASTPTNAKYRIDCATTGAVIRGLTSLTPASALSIPITATDNAIQSDWNARETRVLTVVADDGLSTQVRATARWDVKNLQGSP